VKSTGSFFDGEVFIKTRENQYDYNAEGRLIEERWYNYIPGSGLPVPHYQYRDVHQYDGAGNLVSTIYYTSTTAAEPAYDSRDNNGFDLRYNRTTVAVPFNDLELQERFFTHGIITLIQEFDWDQSANGWKSEESGRVNFVYSGLQVSNKPILSAANLSIYPSPAAENLFIKGDFTGQFEISQLNGQLLSTGSVSGASNRIETSQLPTGMYLLRLKSGNEQYICKFIKE
jgi:hypothetical protein